MNQRFTYRNPKILAHAKECACQNCEAFDGTIVAAHSNLAEHGKAKGMKAADLFVAFLCHRCHSWLDQGTGRDPTGVWCSDRDDKREMFLKAMFRTQIILLRDRVIG